MLTNYATSNDEDLNNMTDSRLSEIIEYALEKRSDEEMHPIIMKAAGDMFNRGWKYAVESKYLIKEEFSTTESQVDKRACNKVFATVFNSKEERNRYTMSPMKNPKRGYYIFYINFNM